MIINIDFIKIIILLLPGIIALFIFEMLSGKKEKNLFRDFIKIILNSFIIYFIVYLIKGNDTQTILFLTNSNSKIVWNEVILSVPIAIVVAFFMSLTHKINIINKVGLKIRVTKRYGDEDLWEFFFNQFNIEWFFIRDHKLDLLYYGNVRVFSETKEDRELIMENVTVYRNDTAEKLYEIPTLYISRAKYDLSIEKPL